MTLADRPAAKSKRPKKKHPLTVEGTTRLKASLRAKSPSEPWVDAQIRSVEGVDADGEPETQQFHDPRAFPPGGVGTGMVRCPICGVLHPPTIGGGPGCHEHAVERVMRVQEPKLVRRYGEAKGRSKAGKLRARLDRVARNIDEAFGASPSAAVIRQLQLFNLRMKECNLEPEDKRALSGEIRRSQRKARQRM